MKCEHVNNFYINYQNYDAFETINFEFSSVLIVWKLVIQKFFSNLNAHCLHKNLRNIHF